MLSLVSVGAPAPGTTVRIVAPNGAVLPEGRIGQLQVASARVTPGYLGNLEADRAAFPIGNWPARKWLATGDQGFITGGQVVITGRDSERIIMSGKLYYAHDIETVAASVVGAEHGLVAACGVADAETGTDRLVVFYALTPESIPGMDQAIRSLIQGRLGLVGRGRRRTAARLPDHPRRQDPPPPPQTTLDRRHPRNPPRPVRRTRRSQLLLRPRRRRPPRRPRRTRITTDEDPSERTTELPVVRLAWKRTLQQSIPTPPQRPTLGPPGRHPSSWRRPPEATRSPPTDSRPRRAPDALTAAATRSPSRSPSLTAPSPRRRRDSPSRRSTEPATPPRRASRTGREPEPAARSDHVAPDTDIAPEHAPEPTDEPTPADEPARADKPAPADDQPAAELTEPKPTEPEPRPQPSRPARAPSPSPPTSQHPPRSQDSPRSQHSPRGAAPGDEPVTRRRGSAGQGAGACGCPAG